ncbi:zinc finger protein Xfin-like [Drosophila montana]|uniref:zinc finger protein Xfin-like n=1 Tax=Drosophila montana TaxID=40370 RepID=UPI00313AC996
MEELCRVCMENSDILTDIFAPLINLQTKREPEISMADILNELTGCNMIVNYNSELPQYICTNCMKGAKAALDFKRMVERNSERFMELHSMPGDQKSKVKLKQEEDDLIAICNMLNAEDLQLMDNLEEETKELHIEANATHHYNTRRKRINRHSVSSMSSESFLTESGQDYEDEKKSSLACPYCQIVQSSKGNLKAHLRTHTGERPFKFAACPKSCAEDLQLMDNLEEETKELNIEVNSKHHYNTRQKRLNRYSVSNMSSESFLTESGQDYEDEKKSSLACPYCQIVQSSKGNLKAHLRTHTGERPFQCPHCPRTFTQKHNMTVHIRTHTGERPFKCAACPKSFAQLAGLIAHNRRRPWDHILGSKHVIKQKRLKKYRRMKVHN